jgi:DNA mismatch repair ATPase MutL
VESSQGDTDGARGSTPTETQEQSPLRRDRERSTSSPTARDESLIELAPRPTQFSVVSSTPSSSIRPSGISFRRIPAEELEYDEDQDELMEVDNQPKDDATHDELLPDSQTSSVPADNLDEEILATAQDSQDPKPLTVLPLKQTKLDTRGASWSVQRTVASSLGKRNGDAQNPPATSQKRLRSRLESFARYDSVAPMSSAGDTSELNIDAVEGMSDEDAEVAEDDASMGETFTHEEISGRSDDPEVVTSSDVRRTRVRCPLDRIRSRYAHSPTDTVHHGEPITTSAVLGSLEDADISVSDPARAEAALSRVISKDDFGIMEVVGQFNSSFIIARLRNNAPPGSASTDDLFIIGECR